MRGKFWLNFFLVCVGILTGSMVAELTSGVPYMKWLSYGLNFGLEEPVVLNLNVLVLTFGVQVRITIATVIFVALSLLLGKLIVKK